MSISPGARLGAYAIAETIGSGGMGEVWRAHDTSLKRDVAIKVLPRAFVDDADRLARFQREAEILASLNHPNIAQVYGLERAEGQTAIVMELVEGPTLADRIAEGPIPPDEAMGIALQVAGALEAAHERQIVHRDLKPANVKLTADGTVKVLDFGISKSLDPSAISGGSPVMTTPAVTQTGIILGTAAYMSPEQARGKFVDQRTDIWAFGCLLFEMLTGQPAFGGEDVMLTLARVLDRDTDLSSIPKTISPAVRHTLKLCLEKDPRKRIADIRDVRLALDGKFETEYPGAASPIDRAPAWRRALVPVTALVVGGLVVGVLSWAMLRPEPPRITRFADALPDGVDFHNIQDLDIAIAAAGNMIAYGAGNALYVRRLNDLEPRRLEQTAGEGPVHPVFSPDGDWIAYWSQRRGELRKVAIEGGSPVTITQAPEDPYGPRWTADDFILYGRGGKIVEVPASGGQEPTVLLDTKRADPVVAPFILPGGKTVLFTGGGDGQTYAASLETGELTPLFPGTQAQFLEGGRLVYSDNSTGSLMARGFDPATLEVGGPVSLVDDDFRVSGAAAQFALSPSGTLAYIQGHGQLSTSLDSGMQLAIGGADGQVEPLDVPRNNYTFPRVSPDGARLAVQVNVDDSHANIFVYDLSGQSEIRQLTFAGDRNENPFWKDTETLLFASNREGKMRIYQQRVDGGTAVALTDPASDEPQTVPAMTPDGRLAYDIGSIASGDARIRVLSADGEPEPLILGDALGGVVDFSPHDNLMAYISIGPVGAQYSIYVERYPSDGSKRLASSPTKIALHPVWVRSGEDSPLTLLYEEPVEGTVQAVDISLPGLDFGNRRTLFPYAGTRGSRQVDSIPGTGKFIVVWAAGLAAGGQTESQLPRRIIVIENWAQEVKQRVKAP